MFGTLVHFAATQMAVFRHSGPAAPMSRPSLSSPQPWWRGWVQNDAVGSVEAGVTTFAGKCWYCTKFVFILFSFVDSQPVVGNSFLVPWRLGASGACCTFSLFKVTFI